MKTPTALLLEIATAPGNMLRVYGENRAEDANLLAAFGFVLTVADEFGPSPSADLDTSLRSSTIARAVTVRATSAGLDLSRRIASH